MPAAVQTESLPGDYAVQVLDASGRLLSEITLPLNFRIQVEPVGPRPTDTVPLLVTIPYTDSAVRVEIVRSGQLLISVTSSAKVLSDAIKAIPDFGFVKNPEQRRDALLNKTQAIEEMAARGGTRGELQKLKNDLRKQVEDWLISGYTKRTPVQLEKNEVLNVIDKMIVRLETLTK